MTCTMQTHRILLIYYGSLLFTISEKELAHTNVAIFTYIQIFTVFSQNLSYRYKVFDNLIRSSYDVYNFCIFLLIQSRLHNDADAYIVVYSVTDAQSFAHACDLLNTLCETGNQHKAVILVANKCDIVRNRTVQEHGKHAHIINIVNVYIVMFYIESITFQ